MKKIKFLLAITIFFSFTFSIKAQVRANNPKTTEVILDQEIKWENNVPKDCFCCDEKVYNLPQTPPITGPQTVSCGTKAVFTTIPCKGASLNWSVSPSISGTIGANTATFTIPDNAPAGNYVITLEFRCGNKVFKNQVKFSITEVRNCTSDFTFSVQTHSDGSATISTVPTLQVAGQEHWWGLQYNGTFPNCNPCASIPFNQMNASNVWGGYIGSNGILSTYMGTGITTGTTPFGISYRGFSVNKCVRITHYVKCCGVLKRTTYCFDITGAVNKVIKSDNNSNKIVDEIVEGKY